MPSLVGCGAEDALTNALAELRPLCDAAPSVALIVPARGPRARSPARLAENPGSADHVPIRAAYPPPARASCQEIAGAPGEPAASNPGIWARASPLPAESAAATAMRSRA